MALQTRVYLVACAVLLATAVVAFVANRGEKVEQAYIIRSGVESLKKNAQHWIELSGAPMRAFVEDHSWWYDMVDFVANPDPEWTANSLEDTWDLWGIDAMWVFDPAGREVYSLVHPSHEELTFPLTHEELFASTRDNDMLHFHRPTPQGFLELRSAPIQPSGDDDRITSPQGWFLAGRVWDDQLLQEIAPSEAYRISVESIEPWPADGMVDGQLIASQAIADENGRLIARWQVSQPAEELEDWEPLGINETVLFSGFGVLLTLGFFVMTQRGVIRPLRCMDKALTEGKPRLLDPLADKKNIIGRLALSIQHMFQQQHDLRRESRRRKLTEQSLIEKEESLRATMMERSQLSTDLHDSTIQILYASGLSLAAIQKRVAASSPEIADRIKDIRHNLQVGVDDLRWFISSMEQPGSTRTLDESIDTMLALLRNTDQVTVDSEIDDDVAEKLTADQRIQLLQILRESITNAIKHAQASRIEIRLRRRPGKVRLTVDDDGVGISSRSADETSRGLQNMQTRAARVNARLEVGDRRGGGTRVDVSFSTPH